MWGQSTTGSTAVLGRQESLLIDRILAVHEQDVNQGEIKDITKNHWMSAETRTKCFQKSCRKKFTFLERPHHCRRCGEVFCLSCVKFRRRLNKLAKPDPDGKEYKVCEACYDKGPQQLGCTRNRLEEFYQAKVYCQAYQTAKTMGERRKGWKNRFDLDKERARLLNGFRNELKRSDISKALVDMKKMVAIPDWQKGASWLQESMCTTCQSCNAPFSVLLNKRRQCRVCAVAICGGCSSKKLILYIPDGGNDNTTESGLRAFSRLLSSSQEVPEPQLSVIEIVGCPDKEPDVCLYLRVCEACQNLLTEHQIRSHRNSLVPAEDDFLSKLKRVWEEFMEIRLKIEDLLSKYCDTIDSLENNCAGNTTPGVRSQDNMKLLAKAQTDLSDFFAAYIMKVEKLKRLKQAPASPVQAKLLQNFIKAKCEYYMENMYVFRSMKNKMAEISPPETLDVIQKIVDKDAIISTHLYIKQLIYEVIHLTDKHRVLTELPTALVLVEEKVEKDTEACLKAQGEDWDEHQAVVQQLLKSQIKNHKLIHPSRSLTKRQGVSHIHDITKQRSHEVIESIRLQLSIKSAFASFQKSLEALQHCRSVIREL